MTYLEKLKDPRWQKRRLKILERDQFSCAECGDTTSTLNIHHLRYFKNKDIWDYEDEYLITYCDNCHKEWHRLNKKIDENIYKGWITWMAEFSDLLEVIKDSNPFELARLRRFIEDDFYIEKKAMEGNNDSF